MNQQQIRQMLQNPDLPPGQRAALEAKIAVPAVTVADYDPDMLDKAFEDSEARHEASKQNYRFGGSSALAEIITTPAGNLWHRTFSIRLLGGIQSEVNDDVSALLPALLGTQSEFVRSRVLSALRLLHRFYPELIKPDLYGQLNDALAQHTVQKMESE
jgi:hypothetical protein